MSASAPLPRSRILLYALPALASAVAALPMALFIPAYYAGDLGLSLASVGLALAASRVLDVVTDPLLGTLSDRFPTRWGRRKPWMALGAPVFLLGLWNVFVPPEDADVWWLAGWSAVLYLGFTMIDLPHRAWGAELSPDYDERSRITGWREGLSAFGQVALLVGLVWAASVGVTSPAVQLRALALTVVFGLPLLIGLCFLVPEVPPRPGRPPSFWHGLGLVLKNPAFLRVIVTTVLFVTGIAMQGTLHRMVITDVMGAPDRFLDMILWENVASLLLVPVWLALALRVEKHQALMGAVAWLALFSLPLVVLRSGDAPWMMATVVISGSSFASVLFLSASLAADVIDADTAVSGAERSGLFFAVWGMATKLSLALGVLLGTGVPALWGYTPGAPATDEVATGLMLAYGLMPAALMGLGALALAGFPITRERHAAIQEALRGPGVLDLGAQGPEHGAGGGRA